ncbi:phosphoglucomutase, alpha-D-glucose phosphate-specific [Thermanaeromonas toyohensis ToBE]|uniref:Phosphoglucomutase n=1 Tax=Thermanaeromonas toyohensis ToBE TaxID=698762 RepID=A0A1W1VDK8_9FIRM|nr:phosphoglucomutase/phosphomannomutase family protein [Thermanaeromonas toyohensis]SMB91406.1 phosphoglucomutase, alpha-D-glucose phosphate-specific [Thermanaeromonas toyohensis ToBE]
MGIKFGTDGWRAIIADEFTFSNVRYVVQAIADYLLEETDNRRIVIGYDHRFLAENFAASAAEVLAGNGFTVFLPEKAIPTPVTAFAVRSLEAAGAIMFTASHNPPEYHGLKFIPSYAGPAVPEITSKIEERIALKPQIKHLNLDMARKKGLLQAFDPQERYLKHLEGLLDMEILGRSGLKIIVDPLYGAGLGYLENLLSRAGCQVESIHNWRDPLFGGRLPDPSARGLEELAERVRLQGAHLGLALDGDADRFGVVDSDGTYLTANQVLFLVLAHLVEVRGKRGGVARTVATTHLLDRLARAYGLEVEETPVGFKYIAQALLHKGCILGGEESGGLSIEGHIPEKDGILATGLVAEIRARSGCPLKHLLAELLKRYGPLFSERLDIHVSPESKKKVLNKLTHYEPARLGEQPVVGRVTIDGVKFLLADGSWALIRPSGTEPLFRVYIEAPNQETLKGIREDLRAGLEI